MIYVKELVPPTKMSGLSSFAITPECYSREVYEIISKLTVNRYDPTKTKKDPHYYLNRDGYWEISSVDIRSFLEQATKLDDIHLELYETGQNFDFYAVSEKEQAILIKNQDKLLKHSLYSEFPDWLKRFVDLH